MKRTLSLLLALLLVLPVINGCTSEQNKSLITPGEGETVLYVSADGNDEADGTFDSPLSTLEGAKNKVRSILQGTEGAITVYFRGGDYTLTGSVSFDEEDSGRENSPVSYKAYPGENVRITGGVRVDPSMIRSADTASSVYMRVRDEKAKAALLEADVSSLTDVFPLYYTYDNQDNDTYHQMEVYLGNKALSMARWPNDNGRDSFNYVYIGEDYSGKESLFDNELCRATIYYADDVAERAQNWSEESLQDLYLYGFLEFAWTTDRYKVLEMNREENYLYLSRGANQFAHYTEGGRAYFLNLPEEIDVPGESYIDHDSRKVYFYPTEDYDENNVWLSTLTEDMMIFNGTSHIRFENIDFEYTRGAIINSTGVCDFEMKNCTLAHTSAKAAYFYDAADVHLDGCEIGDTAHGAIVLMGGDRNTLETAGIVIENCDIHDFSRAGTAYSPELSYCYDLYGETAYAPGLYVAAVGTVIRNNKIHGCIHEAIAPESNDIVIEYNEIYDCVTDAADMGAIYYWNNPTLLGLVIRYNYFHDIGGVNLTGQYSIYTDCASMGPDVYGNLFVDAAGLTPEGSQKLPKAVILLAQYAHVHDNVFVNSPAVFRYSDWSVSGARSQNDWVLHLYGHSTYGGCTQRFYDIDFGNEFWHSRYDGTIWGNLFDYFSYDLIDEFNAMSDIKNMQRKAASMAPIKTNEFDNNVLVDIGVIVNSNLDKSLNIHDNYLGDINIFADAANGDYTITDNSLEQILAVCPEFSVVPFESIGPQNY